MNAYTSFIRDESPLLPTAPHDPARERRGPSVPVWWPQEKSFSRRRRAGNRPERQMSVSSCSARSPCPPNEQTQVPLRGTQRAPTSGSWCPSPLPSRSNGACPESPLFVEQIRRRLPDALDELHSHTQCAPKPLGPNFR